MFCATTSVLINIKEEPKYSVQNNNVNTGESDFRIESQKKQLEEADEKNKRLIYLKLQ